MSPVTLEPVRPQSRLVVADVAYTEVEGTPLIVADSATVLRLDRIGAALLVALDGRPLDELLGDDVLGIPADRQPQAIEILRRFKAMGVVQDLAPDGSPVRVHWLEPAPAVTEVTVHARIVASDVGAQTDIDTGAPQARAVTLAVRAQPVAGAAAPPISADGIEPELQTVTLHCAASGPITVVEADVEDSADPDATMTIDRLIITESAAATGRRVAGNATPPTPLDVFVALVDAIAAPSGLAKSSIVDALARLSERLDAAWSRAHTTDR